MGIFLALAASRFIPHPPNFTSLIALSFYVPVLLGSRFIPVVLISFAVTDMFIGMHNVTFFTWGSILVIGLISKYFIKTIISRTSGALVGATIFFIITNFGVWANGLYGYNIVGLISCYTLAIPFFMNTVISTLIFSIFIEIIYWTSKFIRVKKSF